MMKILLLRFAVNMGFCGDADNTVRSMKISRKMTFRRISCVTSTHDFVYSPTVSSTNCFQMRLISPYMTSAAN